jgi:ferredoxin
MDKTDKRSVLNRRRFLKATGAVGAAAGGVGLGFFGYRAGKDPGSYSGWVDSQGEIGSFKKDKYTVARPHYEKTGPSSRVDARTQVIFSRFFSLMNQWDPESGLSGLDATLQEYYQGHPEDLELDLSLRNEIHQQRRKDERFMRGELLLSKIWSKAMGAVRPPSINHPPEISDFPGGDQIGEPHVPYRMKHPAKSSALLKKVAHEFGATLVGIAELNPDWVYKFPMTGRGFDVDAPLDMPEHWKYAVVVGTPMSWDPLMANPVYGTSNDAYSRSRIVAYRLASFLRQLGYAARPHTPGMDYDLMVPPIMVDAGLGEQGRHGVVITPELGCNIRPAVVTTNLPLQPDQPIDFGVQKFCATCKICADNCPSGAITRGGKVEVRGYRRYQLHASRCHNFWYSNLGNLGCRLCIAVCPYTRKSNWLHQTALEISAGDPTGLSHRILAEFQEWLYPGPEPGKYYIPSLGGENASYRNPPWWLKSEDFIEF